MSIELGSATHTGDGRQPPVESKGGTPRLPKAPVKLIIRLEFAVSSHCTGRPVNRPGRARSAGSDKFPTKPLAPSQTTVAAFKRERTAASTRGARWTALRKTASLILDVSSCSDSRSSVDKCKTCSVQRLCKYLCKCVCE